MSWALEIDDTGSVELRTGSNTHTSLTGADMKHLAETLLRLRTQRIEMGVSDSQ